MAISNSTTRAIVAYKPHNGQLNWKLQDTTLRNVGADELLVRVVAVGICHSDLLFGTWPHDQIPYPKVLGHEGSGIVEKVGSNVRNARIGDSVLLSFQICNSCQSCKNGHPSFCDQFSVINYGGESDCYITADGHNVRGSFFGQSSFSQFAIVKSSSIVNVSGVIKDEDELKTLAPMGCGFQTGMGTVDKVASASEEDTVVVLGLGGVGLVSIMAAKLKNCRVIIGVDRLPERLELAKDLGATHVINTLSKDVDIGKEIRTVTDGNGSSVTIDTTGNINLIRAGLDFTANRGQIIFVGVPSVDDLLNVHLITFLQTGKILRGAIEGDVTPSEYIPQMIHWYREGKLPIEKLIKFYPADDFETAISDMKSGAAIKPVLIWQRERTV